MTVNEILTEAYKLSETDSTVLLDAISAINSVQGKISTFAKPLIKYRELTTVNNVLTLPSDFMAIIEVLDTNHRNVEYKRVGKRNIYVSLNGTYTVVYKQLLERVNSTNLTMEIELDGVALDCLIHGVAARLARDNDEIYAILQGEYNNLLQNLTDLDEFENDGIIEESGVQNIDGMWF